jgi:hypothetical protein
MSFRLLTAMNNCSVFQQVPKELEANVQEVITAAHIKTKIGLFFALSCLLLLVQDLVDFIDMKGAKHTIKIIFLVLFTLFTIGITYEINKVRPDASKMEVRQRYLLKTSVEHGVVNKVQEYLNARIKNAIIKVAYHEQSDKVHVSVEVITADISELD